MERVLGGVKQNAPGTGHGEATQARNACRDRDGEVQGKEGFAALGLAADDPDRLLRPQPGDEPALVLGAIGEAPGGLDGQQVHRRRAAAVLASAAGGAAHVSRNSFSSICRASRSAASAPVASGDRGEEAQQRKEPLAAVAAKALDQRDRQAIVIDGRHECGPADLPERARREDVAPPRSPALDRPAVDADQRGQLSHPRGGRALPHDRDQHDCRGEIDLAPEEPQRRRRCACAATVAGAAEAEAPIMLLAEPGRTATRLAAILGGMQNAAAQRASSPPRRNRDVLIKDEKQLMECGVGQQG